jgi:glycopeptide antibiotics resistance protein
MDKKKNRQANPINYLQVLLGILIFLVGALVYIIDRPPEYTYFFNHYKFIETLHNTIPAFFGPLGNHLPDFIHPLSFILITAGIVSCRKKGYRIICLSWFVIDCIFELGQKYSSLFVKAVPDWFSEIPFLEAFKNYFNRGTFDIYDIIAIFLGTGAAYLVLVLTIKKEN